MNENFDHDIKCPNCDARYGIYQDEVDDKDFRCMECDFYLWDDYTLEQILTTEGRTNMFKVFNNAVPVEEVHFKLTAVGGGINLVAVKANGSAYSSGNVLTIRNDGKIVLAGGVNKSIGLQVNPTTGKVTVV